MSEIKDSMLIKVQTTERMKWGSDSKSGGQTT